MNRIKYAERGIVICLAVFLAVLTLTRGAPVVLAQRGLEAPQAQQATQTASYLEALPDLPLMAGVTEVSEQGVLFDTPGGRLVEALAGGAVGAAEVVNFYRLSLPQLGWREDLERKSKGDKKNLVFRRDGEILRIEVTPLVMADDAVEAANTPLRKNPSGEPYLEIRFSLKPE